MKRVFIKATCSEYNKTRLMERFQEDYQLIFKDQLPEDCQEETLCKECEIIIGEPDYEQIKDSKKLEWVQMTWAGTDKYTKNGPFPEHVMLTNASGAFGVIISEYVLGGILALYRRFPYYMKKKEEKIWSPLAEEDIIFGKKALILGAGNIGTEVARRLQAFDCQVYGIRRHPKPSPYYKEQGGMDKLDEWIAMADIIVCAMPNNKESMDLLSYDLMKTMKEKAMIVNVGRGHLFQEGALEKILEENRIYGAVLDVQRLEPLPENHIFWTHPNVLLTPHIAGPSFSTTKHTQNCIYDIVIDNLERYKKGLPLKNMAEF